MMSINMMYFTMTIFFKPQPLPPLHLILVKPIPQQHPKQPAPCQKLKRYVLN